ncbi:calcium-binding protein [Roseomonas sp. CAU 1739]|uniref:calcium-binding protein n=1 Tax=Roseomonas sp. CAU 1739 TaxID=3140364 RepID=UPI00325A51A6
MAIITGTNGNDTVTTTTSSFGPLTTGGNDSVIALDGNDYISGGSGLDTLRGGNGGDSLFGGNDDDYLFGDAGDDELYGGAGNDVMDGGAGFDLVSFNSDSTAGGVSVTVTNVGGVNTGTSAPAPLVLTQGNDTFTNFEQINGSSADDTITIASVNTVLGFNVRGNGGNDILTGTAAPNTSLFLDYRSSAVTSGVSVDLTLGRATDGLGGIDTISNFYAVRGSILGDTLLGSAEIDRFRGRGGNDYLDGRDGFDIADYSQATGAVSVNLAIGRAQDGEGGTDTLTSIEEIWGTTGNDTLTGSGIDENFYAFNGNDTIDGGSGQDRVGFQFTAGNVPAGTQGVVVNLVTGVATDAWGGTDTLISIERITGTALADSMLGGAETNRFRGRGGDDTLDGGLGSDHAEYQNATAGVTVNLTSGTASDGEGGTDKLISIENVIGSNFADRLTGVAQLGRTTSLLRGGGGNDTLVGIGGQFVLADYADQTVGLSINLGTGTANDGRGGIDTLNNIRGVSLFGNFADTVIGTANSEWFNPSEGADSINAGLGFDIVGYGGTDVGGVSVNLATGRARDTGGAVDTIIGFEGVSASFGDDSIYGSTAGNLIGPAGGADFVNAGLGEDTVSYSLGFSPDGTQFTANEAGDRLPVQGVTVDLVTLRATDYGGAIDTIIGFEHAIGSTAGDILRGSALANILDGAEGNDTIEGRAGADTLDGGTGNDRMVGGADNDTYIVDAALDTTVELANQGIDTVLTGLAARTLAVNVENIVATTTIAHNFIGNTLANAMTGSSGADTLSGLAGNDTLDGGAGIDRLVGGLNDDLYVVTTGDVVVEALNQGIDTVQSSSGAFVLAANIETLVLTGTATNGTGNGLANTLIGNAAGNILNGGAGSDTIDGGGGVDFLIGGTGQDFLTGGGAADRFRFLTVADSTVATPDVITDFNFVTEGDRIDLSLIDANANLAGDQGFTYRGAAFTPGGAAGDLRVESLGGNFYLAAGDVDGNGTADFAILLQSSTAAVGGWFIP